MNCARQKCVEMGSNVKTQANLATGLRKAVPISHPGAARGEKYGIMVTMVMISLIRNNEPRAEEMQKWVVM